MLVQPFKVSDDNPFPVPAIDPHRYVPLVVLVCDDARRQPRFPDILRRESLRILQIWSIQELINQDVVLVARDQETHPLYREALARLPASPEAGKE